MDAEGITRHHKAFLRALPELSGFLGSFASINKRWGAAITAGMIEAGRMDQEAANLFNPLIQDMGSTKEKFRLIQNRLVNAILQEIVRKAVLELSDAAKFAINILKRNLYERTADVGYLATDSVLQAFLALDPEDPDQDAARERVVRRLGEYREEYTVYDEIILLDLEGRVRAHLDGENPIRRSADPLLAETLALDPSAPGDKYVETFRRTDLRPGKDKALVYSQTMLHPDHGRPLGVLCLCFDFEDELRRIFEDLAQGNPAILVCILDERGAVIASSNPRTAPLGSSMPLLLDRDFDLVPLAGREFLAATRATDGYQGFFGLTWYGQALVDLEQAFAASTDQGHAVQVSLERISPELDSIQRESDDILADMTLDSLNGQVKAAKFKADGFVEVLRFVNGIGREIGRLFSESIAGLTATILSSQTFGLQFRAFQANNIADRNLYERANDVCWWALTPRFREALARLDGAAPDEDTRERLRQNLQYINDLYTPYLRLVLADTRGRVVAVSDPPTGLDDRQAAEGCLKGQDFVGQTLSSDLVHKALRLAGPGDYAVSAFEPSPLYGQRPTWVFTTAVRDPGDERRVAGVIQIVFDAEPQLAAMLADVLPRDEHGRPLPGGFALFVERSGRIVSSTSPDLAAGRTLALPPAFPALAPGQRAWEVHDMDGRPRLTGCQAGAGYREFKVTDGYDNDLLCLVSLPL